MRKPANEKYKATVRKILILTSRVSSPSDPSPASLSPAVSDTEPEESSASLSSSSPASLPPSSSSSSPSSTSSSSEDSPPPEAASSASPALGTVLESPCSFKTTSSASLVLKIESTLSNC